MGDLFKKFGIADDTLSSSSSILDDLGYHYEPPGILESLGYDYTPDRKTERSIMSLPI